MSWFERLTGFAETDYESTRNLMEVRGDRLHSKANKKSWRIGQLETPSLAELRARALAVREATCGELRVRNIAADAYQLHGAPEIQGALVQVASQFNLLEMLDYHVSPEQGVRRYENDPTQGPACARAAGAATIYRNYFVPVGDGIGQSRQRQIDTLADLRAALPGGHRIVMRNGYALADAATLQTIQAALESARAPELDALRARLRIGIHQDVEVTVPGAPQNHCVSQAFCSALPVSYNHGTDPLRWQPFASLVLEAAYEATLLAGVLNEARPGGSNKVYLTLLGGGAFGNRRAWILAAIRRALSAVQGLSLEVFIVSFQSVPQDLVALASEYRSRA